MAQTVRAFLDDCYRLIDPSTPTVPLHGNDASKMLQYMNELLSSYSATGLMLTIAKQVDFVMSIGQQNVVFADPSYTGIADVKQGRLSNLQNAWLTLDGVTYPIIDESRNVFYDSYKYDPQEGLPRFCIVTFNNETTTMRIYPSPSQLYNLSVYGKFELATLTINDDLSGLPGYYTRYLRFAVAKDTAMYKGRAAAWTDRLEQMYLKSEKEMMAASPLNLAIQTDHDSYLNGSWRVKAGV